MSIEMNPTNAVLINNRLSELNGTSNIIVNNLPVKPPENSKGKIIIISLTVIVFIGGVIAIIILLVVPAVNKKLDAMKSDWINKRCTPLYRTFPGMFGPPGMTSEINDAECSAAAHNASFSSNIGPIQGMIDSQTSGLNHIVQTAKNTQKMVLSIRDSIMSQVNDIYQKLYNMYKRIAYLFKVFAKLFYRIFETFTSLFETVQYAVWTLMSVWVGPIGGLVRAFCFSDNTFVKLSSNSIIKMSDVKIGDIIDNNCIVGVCLFKKTDGNQFYKLDDVYVSGMHIVEYNGSFIRVHSHPNAIKVEYNIPTISCLITDTGRFKIGNNYYSDYLGENTLETYLKLVTPLLEITDDLSKYENNALNLYPGFTQDSILRVDSGVKIITEIKIGDKIKGKSIIGIVRYILEGSTFISEYDDGYNLCKLVGIQICKNNGKYIQKNKCEQKILGKLECTGLLIEGGIIELGINYMVTDFDIISDELRNKVEDSLQKLYSR